MYLRLTNDEYSQYEYRVTIIMLRLDWEDENDWDILHAAMANDSPAIIATDGGHIDETGNSPHTAAAVVLCASDLDPVGNDASWLEESCEPVLVRICLLPKRIGATSADNGHAELLALNLAEELLPTNCPAVIITDSETV